MSKTTMMMIDVMMSSVMLRLRKHNESSSPIDQEDDGVEHLLVQPADEALQGLDPLRQVRALLLRGPQPPVQRRRRASRRGEDGAAELLGRRAEAGGRSLRDRRFGEARLAHGRFGGRGAAEVVDGGEDGEEGVHLGGGGVEGGQGGEDAGKGRGGLGFVLGLGERKVA